MDPGIYVHRFRGKRPKDGVEWDQSQIDPMLLLRQVKKYPFLFNSNHEKYRDKLLKRAVWYRICEQMFPEFQSYSETTKFQIDYDVRRRWVGLRVAITREAKQIANSGSKLKTLRKGVRQLEFLMPYISSEHCQKLAKEWGIQRLPNDDVIPKDIEHLVDTKRSAQKINSGDLDNYMDAGEEDDDDDEYGVDDDDISSSEAAKRPLSLDPIGNVMAPTTTKTVITQIHYSDRKQQLLTPEKPTENNQEQQEISDGDGVKETFIDQQTIDDDNDDPEDQAISVIAKPFALSDGGNQDEDGISVNSRRLLDVVKKYPFIYNPYHKGFRDRILRSEGWKRICMDMFPEYVTSSKEVKFNIDLKIRRRWASLRGNVATEARQCTKLGYTARMLRSDMEYLMPYIRSPHCKRMTKLWNIKRLPNDDAVPDDMAGRKYKKFSDSQTVAAKQSEESFIEKPRIHNVDNDEDNDDGIGDDVDGSDEDIALSCLLPTSTTGRNANTNGNEPLMHRKRNYNDIETVEVETQRKLLDYLLRLEKRQQEEMSENVNDSDRMFLLSLTDDFKRIPANKKISVKAKIATVLIQALQK